MLAQIERGEGNSTLSTLWKLSNGMKVPFDALTVRPKVPYEIVKTSEIQPLLELCICAATGGKHYKHSSCQQTGQDMGYIIMFHHECLPPDYFSDFLMGQLVQHNHALLNSILILRMTRHGFPTASEFSGISFVTTLPAPITEPSPMVTPGSTTTPPPSQQPFPIRIGKA